MANNDESKAFACFAPGTGLKPWTFKLRPLGNEDVEIKITHSGCCHSDLHTIEGEWGKDKPWPIVPGHEIVGVITKLGPKATRFQLGQRVGVGPQAGSCMKCEQCTTHHENYCHEGIMETYGDKREDGYITQGGYARYHRVHQNYVIPIPDEIPSAEAAPLLCAGVTVYTPLKYSNIKPGDKVGVIGIGGLGHLGLMIAAAMGAEVTAISTTPSKEPEAKKFGASRFLLLTDEKAMKSHKRYFNKILHASSATIDLKAVLDTLQSLGQFMMVGAGPGFLNFEPFDIIPRGVTISGTMIGSPSEIEEMFHFCGKHKIFPQIEVLPWSQCNVAMQKMRDNTVKYRYVMTVDDDNTLAQ